MTNALSRPIDSNQCRKLVVCPSTLIPLSMILCFPGLCVGQEWARYINQTDRFTVNFPGEPVVEEFGYLSEYGVVFPARTYTVDDPPRSYSITVVDHSETERLHKERSAQTGIEVYAQEWISDVLGSIAYTAWNIRQRSHEITYDAFHTVDRIAHELLSQGGTTLALPHCLTCGTTERALSALQNMSHFMCDQFRHQGGYFRLGFCAQSV